ncbi:MAG: hypothetical protein HY332_14400 [Chloroflexi bacterium]|nr:hypothetical protein [Chloroflexota bacterium]
MQQRVHVKQPAEQVLNDAAAFFTKRRAKIDQRTESGLWFGLQGAGTQDGGRVAVAPAPGGGTDVTVEADNIALVAMADNYVRELRKQAREAERQRRPEPAGTLRGGFGDLRQRLGMPAPLPPRPRPSGPPRGAGAPSEQAERTDRGERPEGYPRGERGERSERGERPERYPGGQRGDRGRRPVARPTAAPATLPVAPAAVPEEARTEAAAQEAFVISGTRHVHPDGSAPEKAPIVSPETGPQSPPGRPSPVEAPHPSFVGPESDQAESQESPPVKDSLASTPPSPEATGGVPKPEAGNAKGASPTAFAPTAAGSETSPPTTDPSVQPQPETDEGAPPRSR